MLSPTSCFLSSALFTFFYRFLELNQASVDGGEWDQVEDGILAMDRCAGIGLGRSGTAYGLARLSAFGLGMGSVW